MSSQTHVSWKDLLSLTIAKSDKEQRYGDLVGVHKSGRLVRLSIPSCLNCQIQSIQRGAGGFIIHGQLTFVNSKDESIEQATIIHWNGKTVRKISNEKVSKIEYRNGIVSLELQDQNTLKTQSLDSRPLSEVQSDSWKDFVIFDDGKTLVASSDPWPAIRNKHFLIEKGERLLKGQNFVINSAYNPSPVKGRASCNSPEQSWTSFYKYGDSFKRSILPAIGQSGSSFYQNDHHIFVVDAEGNLSNISAYSQLPIINDIYKTGTSIELDDINNILFDGYNTYQISSRENGVPKVKPFTRIQYPFESLDYTKKLFGSNHGFLSNYGSISMDGNYVEISKTSGLVLEETRKKIIYDKDLKNIELFKHEEGIYALDFSEKRFLVSQVTDDGLLFKTEKVLLNAKNFMSAKLMGQKIIGLSDYHLWELDLETFKRKSLAKASLCREVYGFSLNNGNSITTLQKCSQKPTLVELDLTSNVSKIMTQSEELSIFVDYGKSHLPQIRQVNESVLISSLGRDCNPIIARKLSGSSIKIMASNLDNKILDNPENIIKLEGGYNSIAFSWDDSSFLINGQIDKKFVSYIVTDQTSYPRLVHPLVGLDVKQFIGLKNGQALIHGELKGSPYTYLIYKDGTSVIKIVDQESLFLGELLQTPSELSNIN